MDGKGTSGPFKDNGLPRTAGFWFLFCLFFLLWFSLFFGFSLSSSLFFPLQRSTVERWAGTQYGVTGATSAVNHISQVQVVTEKAVAEKHFIHTCNPFTPRAWYSARAATTQQSVYWPLTCTVVPNVLEHFGDGYETVATVFSPTVLNERN